jgi:hypothetical protein
MEIAAKPHFYGYRVGENEESGEEMEWVDGKEEGEDLGASPPIFILVVVGFSTRALGVFVFFWCRFGGELGKKTGLPLSDGRTPRCGAGSSLDEDRIWGRKLKEGKTSSCHSPPGLDAAVRIYSIPHTHTHTHRRCICALLCLSSCRKHLTTSRHSYNLCIIAGSSLSPHQACSQHIDYIFTPPSSRL